jgi:hypothetical protein
MCEEIELKSLHLAATHLIDVIGELSERDEVLRAKCNGTEIALFFVMAYDIPWISN